MNDDFLRSVDALLREPQLSTTASWIDQPLLVYGAGGCGRLCAGVLRGQGCKVVGFIDRNSTNGSHVDGLPVLSLSCKSAGQISPKDCAVVLGIFNHFTDICPIVQQLREAGFDKLVTFYDLCDEFSFPESSRYWVCPRKQLSGSAEEILCAAKLYSDQKSKELFLEALKLRIRGDINCLRIPDLSGHYLPADLSRPKSPVRFVDGGAYNGDTIRYLSEAGLKLGAVLAFEPDPSNYRDLVTAVRSLGIAEALLLPCGIGSSSEVLRFDTGHGEASSLDPEGATMIQILSLDEAFGGFKPNFIKLDIEGGELAALNGMKHTLHTTPEVVVAACVYHRPSHFWEVPLLMKQLMPDHSLHLRSHGFCGFDLVAYAYPPSHN